MRMCFEYMPTDSRLNYLDKTSKTLVIIFPDMSWLEGGGRGITQPNAFKCGSTRIAHLQPKSSNTDLL